MGKIRLGIIGTGGIGSGHAAIILIKFLNEIIPIKSFAASL